jgi:branched-chain amino acid transport system substrate-binding protein
MSRKLIQSNSAITKLQATILIVVVVCVIAGVLIVELRAPPKIEKPIKIGGLLDLTGALAAYGYSHEKTLSAAIRKINEEGGINGRLLELYVEDTETNPTVATMKFRKLIEYWDVDFVLGPNHSGEAIACAPIAKELKTVFFGNIGATEFTTTQGNRYVFRICSNVRQEVRAIAAWGFANLGKKWVTIVADYSWGWSYEEEFKALAAKHGVEILATIRAPVGTKDFMPYIAKIPANAEAALVAFFGTDLLCLLRDLRAVRPDLKIIIGNYGLTGIRTEDVPETEGVYIVGPFPRRLESLDTPYTREFRKLIGMDEEGCEVGNPKIIYVHAYNWAVWEAVFAIKKAIEVSGWKSKADNPALIKTLEGMELKESLAFPQGSKTIRAQDHQAFPTLFIEQVVNGKLRLIAKIPPERTIYDPEVDYTREPL